MFDIIFLYSAHLFSEVGVKDTACFFCLFGVFFLGGGGVGGSVINRPYTSLVLKYV